MTDPLPKLERVRIDDVVYVRMRVHMPAFDPSGKPAAMLIAVDRWGKEEPNVAAIVPEHLLITPEDARKAVSR